MFSKNAVVLYKNLPCLVTEKADSDKFVITWCSSRATATGKKAVYSTQKVREKDVALLCPEPASNIDNVLAFGDKALEKDSEINNQITEIYELLSSDDETANQNTSFDELCSLIRGEVKADEVWGVYQALKNRFEFSDVSCQDGIYFKCRTSDEVKALKEKADEKNNAEQIRSAFIQRLKDKKLDLPADSKYMVDVEALALGKTDKSRTMHDAGIKETPEKAHKLLLDTGIWDITRNPYPVRWGLSMQSATEGLATPPCEDRIEVPGISYAIDNAWSTDPDDAIAWDGEYLWVHIADPASTVLPDSDIDKSARNRGATLYIPEGAARMLSEDCLEDYALGLTEKSRALSFRIKFTDTGDIEDCTVLKTLVNVKRLTYEGCDELKEDPSIKPLFEIAERNFERRQKAGAVNIALPEVHITVDADTKKVSIGPSPHPQSADVVREAMVLAGEGAARFAFKNGIPFPFISQEAPDIPKDLPEGLAGQFRLRKCMRRRSVNVTPSVHSGLGVGMYSQVTSPLRRYGDLISHQQLRSFLDGRPLIDKDEMLLRMSAGDAASTASHKAERKSNTHWTLVYLLQNPDWSGEAVCVEKQNKQAVYIIPSIGMETVMGCSDDTQLNSVVTVKASNIDIPNLEVTFSPVTA